MSEFDRFIQLLVVRFLAIDRIRLDFERAKSLLESVTSI